MEINNKCIATRTLPHCNTAQVCDLYTKHLTGPLAWPIESAPQMESITIAEIMRSQTLAEDGRLEIFIS